MRSGALPLSRASASVQSASHLRRKGMLDALKPPRMEVRRWISGWDDPDSQRDHATQDPPEILFGAEPSRS